jgi:hypothetical protein
MITLTKENQLWNTMPGWGIVADLTPPELIAARRLRVVRKAIIGALAFMLVLSVAGYTMAYLQNRSAQSALTAEQIRGTQLQASQKQYVGVTQIQSAVTQVNGQLATLLANDVDLAALVQAVNAAKPSGVDISSLAVTMTGSGASSSASGSGSSLDTSGAQHIGTIEIDGGGTRLTDAATYVDNLLKIKGVVAAVPTTNQQIDNVVQYAIQVTVTDALYTHRYATQPVGGK